MSDESLELHVAPGSPGDRTFNRIVLSGTDIEIPLEIDLDEDPNTDDAIRLVEHDGGYERVLEDGDPDVIRDKTVPFLHCTFRLVPPGSYDVDVRLHNKWHTVIAGLEVTRHTVRFNGESFVRDGDLGAFAESEPVDGDEEPDDAVEDHTIDCSC